MLQKWRRAEIHNGEMPVSCSVLLQLENRPNRSAAREKPFSVSLNARLVFLDKNNRDIWRKTEKASEAD